MTDDATKAAVDGLFPIRDDAEPISEPSGETVLLDDDTVGEIINALTSSMARDILEAIHETPRTPPEVRDDVGTTLQNVHYHLRKLEDVGLVEETGAAIHRRGGKMRVYGPVNDPLVLVIGGRNNMEDDTATTMTDDESNESRTEAIDTTDDEWSVVTRRPVVVQVRGPLDASEPVETGRGTVYAAKGDYIIRGPCDWKVPVSADQYERLYRKL